MPTALDLLRQDEARSLRVAGLRAQAAAKSAPSPTGKSARFFDRPQVDGSGVVGEKLSKPYAQSVWVQRAIKYVSGPISAVPLTFSTDARGGDQKYQDPKLSAWWRAPAVGMRYADFIKASVGWRKLAGECFWIQGDDTLVPFPEVRDLAKVSKLIVARPDRMRHVVKDGVLYGWEFTDGSGRRHALLPQQVIQIKEWNPYDEWRGLSEYESAQIAAETDYQTGVFARNLMRNNGDRGEYIIAKNGVTDDAQREQIIADLRAKRHAASLGQFRPVFLTGEISVEDPSIQSLDGNVISMRAGDRHQIFIAFGVPPSMAEVMSSYSVGSASDRYRLIEETCMPEGESLADGIETISTRLTGKVLYAAFDWDEHSVMQAVRRERVDSAVKLWATGMPMEKANDYLRLGLPKYDGWEIGYLPFSVAPVGEGLEPTKDPALAEPVAKPTEDPAAIENMEKLLIERRARKVVPTCAKAGAPHVCKAPRDIARWRDYMSKRRQSVKRMTSAVDRSLLQARAETLQNIERLIPSAERSAPPATTKAVAADLVFDKKTFADGLFARLRKTALQALNEAGNQLYDEVKKDDPFSMPPAEVINYWRQRQNELSDVPDEVYDDIKISIEDGLNKGETMEQLSARVRTAFNDVSNERADRIAQTETSSAYGVGRQQAMQSAGVQRKAWLTSGNDNVRAAHEVAGDDYSPDKAIPIDEPFIVDGEELMHPGDPNGSAGNIINCHCVSIPIVEDLQEDDE